MEDSFRVRVDRVFGSLSSSSSSSSSSTTAFSSSSSSQPFSSSPWSLTDEEIEKRVWTRESNYPGDGDGDDANYASAVDGFFAKRFMATVGENSTVSRSDREELENDLDDLDDDDDDEVVDGGGEEAGLRGCSSRAGRTEDYDEDEWEVRNSIGMDCTLDFEEEEDEYDKLAVGREKSSEHLFMNDVTDYVPRVSSYNELPSSFKQAMRDPRANHLAAKLRLKEDSEAAGNFNSLRVSDETVQVPTDIQTNAESEDGNSRLKSILKRKENPSDLKPDKRVRFDPSCKTNDERESKGDGVFKGAHVNEENNESQVTFCLPQFSFNVPDYVQNPSKYTCYTFDSTSDMNEESNRQAYMDFLDALKRSKRLEPEEAPADLSKRVIFNPKRKGTDSFSAKNGKRDEQDKEIVMEESVQKRTLPIILADDDTKEDEVSEMDEDEPEVKGVDFGTRKKTARQYRSKVHSN
ncbi:hypothetical protein Dimus_013037 [Dionaea muscipula]